MGKYFPRLYPPKFQEWYFPCVGEWEVFQFKKSSTVSKLKIEIIRIDVFKNNNETLSVKFVY